MKKLLVRVLLIALITYVLIEILCFSLIKTGYIKAPLPQFFSDPKDTITYPFTYADINKYWGVWHYNYPVKTSINNCLVNECIPNSAGARDKERIVHGDSKRIIVLGDSFMEGFGIDVTSRASDILENKTGLPFLNFACADMGSTQEYLVYKNLASQYDHNTVLIGILPKNDFLNDDKSFDSIQTPRRYKPYWKGIYPDMQISYYAESLQESGFNYETFKKYKETLKYKVRYLLTNTTCWFNVMYFIQKKKGISDYIRTKTSIYPYSGYYDFTNDEMLRLQQSLLSIKQIAQEKKVIVFTIPTADDYTRFHQADTTPPVVTALGRFCKNSGIIYLDLLTSKKPPANYMELFFDCDMHWNEKGNAWAAEQLYPLFK